MNIGYHIAMADRKAIMSGGDEGNEEQKNSSSKWDCVIFHDLDMLPMDMRNSYNCAEKVSI